MKKNSYILRKTILLFISILSLISFYFIYDAYDEYWNNVDAGLGIIFMVFINIILGGFRLLASIKTELSILFRIQEFVYSFFIALPFISGIFLGISLGNNNHVSMFGKTVTVISIICSVFFLIRTILWKNRTIKQNE